MANEHSESKAIVSVQIDRKLTALEERAVALEREFERILKRTAEIELWAKHYETKVSEEKRLLGLLHTLIRPEDKRSTILINHLAVFFDEVLTRLENNGMRYNTLKLLYKDITKEGVCSAFGSVLNEMGFTANEIDDLKLVIELVNPKVQRKSKLAGAYELHCSENDPNQIPTELKFFLQMRDDLDEQMRSVLNKVVTYCYSNKVDLQPSTIKTNPPKEKN